MNLGWDEVQCQDCGNIIPEEQAVYLIEGGREMTLCEMCADERTAAAN